MKENSQIVGNLYERLAEAHLAEKGFKTIAKNVRYPFGELDLVMKDKNTLVFVEVRFRKNSNFGTALESITRSKQEKIILAAKAYLMGIKGEIPSCRFDVVAITGLPPSGSLEHVEDAFS